MATRIQKQATELRRRWINDNPPNHQGAWVCFWCSQWVYAEGFDPMEIGHKVAKGGLSMEEASDPSNLGPIHRSCNREQSSTPYTNPRTPPENNSW